MFQANILYMADKFGAKCSIAQISCGRRYSFISYLFVFGISSLLFNFTCHMNVYNPIYYR